MEPFDQRHSPYIGVLRLDGTTKILTKTQDVLYTHMDYISKAKPREIPRAQLSSYFDIPANYSIPGKQ